MAEWYARQKVFKSASLTYIQWSEKSKMKPKTEREASCASPSSEKNSARRLKSCSEPQ